MTLKTAFLKVVALALVGWLAIIFYIWTIHGNPFSSDAHLVEFGICSTDTQYEPVDHILIGNDHFYLCGKVVGSTGQPGSLLVRYNSRPVYSSSSTFGPGIFFQPVRITDSFVVGEYEAIFAYSRQQLASKTFIID